MCVFDSVCDYLNICCQIKENIGCHNNKCVQKMLLHYVFMFALQSVVLSLGSWEDLTSQFLHDCDHSQALFESSESVADVWNHGFALLAVLYASFNCDNRFFFS